MMTNGSKVIIKMGSSKIKMMVKNKLTKKIR